jgi:uncharacterized protein YlxW (UPF0749 family)
MSGIAERLRTIPSWQVTLFAALLILGFLIAAQARAEAPRVRYTTQERAPLVETVIALQAQQDALGDQILDLRAEMASAEEGTLGSDLLVRQLNEALLGARVAAGIAALEGPGIVLQLDDSLAPVPPGEVAADYRVAAKDLRTVIEELWLAGAEAIAVNGERIVPATSILDIGGTILVNSAYLAPPYQVAAIGPEDLYDVIAASPGFVELIQARADPFGIRISFGQPESVVVPAYVGAATMRYARVAAPSATPEP